MATAQPAPVAPVAPPSTAPAPTEPTPAPTEPAPPAPAPVPAPVTVAPAPPVAPSTDSEEPGGPGASRNARRYQRRAPAPPSEDPNAPVRSGATFEISGGVGFTLVALDSGQSESFSGVSGLNLGLGGWISPRTALTVRVAGTSFVQPIQGVDVRFIAGMLGLSFQHMVSDRAWLGGGGGVGILTTDQDNIEPESGLGFDLRLGVNLFQSAGSAVHLAVEVTPGIYDGLKVTGIGLQLGWQSF